MALRVSQYSKIILHVDEEVIIACFLHSGVMLMIYNVRNINSITI